MAVTARLGVDDRRFLARTFDLAIQGAGRTSPNPVVGAVVVRDGRAIGTGFHKRAGMVHAETEALNIAGDAARGGTLYVSLEPCCHQGRTPPCVEAIIAAGIRRVVAAGRDPNPLVDGRGFARLEEAGIEVAPTDPTFARRANRINEIFVKFMTTGTPFVALKAGMSLDGKIALPTGASKWITSEAARSQARALRRRYDAVLVGIGTVLADDPLLLPAVGQAGPGSEAFPLDRPPVRVVLDSRLRLPPGSRLVTSAAQGDVIVWASDDAPRERRQALENLGVSVRCTGAGRVSITGVLSGLAERGITSILVEGGGEILGSFLAGGHADKLHLFIAPRVLGGQGSLSVFGGDAPATLAGGVALEGWSFCSVGTDVIVEAYPRREASAPRRD